MKTRTIIAALALTVAAPSLAHAIPPCRLSPHTICTIDGPADQRRIPMPQAGAGPRVQRLSDPLPMNLPPPRVVVTQQPAPPPQVYIRNRTTIINPEPVFRGRRDATPHFAPDYHGWAGGRRR